MGELLCVLATLVLLLVNSVAAISCYSCANDFIVWHWRHFFLKRNYGLTASDESCVRADYRPDETQPCPSTCFILYLNGTNRYNGKISVLGVGRGCSSQFLTNDQHAQLGLGAHSKVSEIGNYLSSNFDMFDITEHWCFCASDECNQQSCFNTIADEYSGVPYKRRQYTFDNYWLNNTAKLLCTTPLFVICFICSFIIREFCLL
ncbi:hypothetical protein Tcan_16684 [Toxocara canis]|uniref:Protein quiver n=2 Tax=Toxocara canis TaxID=6265 RepID=A0A0B2VG45_TOXCA|nr:hypothetical protein Tcan_16684 [Toxocara canis]VDM44295.1 unnamed protein product [Toxocara canis]